MLVKNVPNYFIYLFIHFHLMDQKSVKDLRGFYTKS